MKLVCPVLAFAIMVPLVQAQKTSGKGQDTFPADNCGAFSLSLAYSQCIGNLLRLQRQLEKQHEEEEKRLEDLNDLLDSAKSMDDWQKILSSKGSDQVHAIVNRIKDLNSKVNQNPISKKVADTSLGLIGKAATTASNNLEDAERSIQDGLAVKEEDNVASAYFHKMLKDHATEPTVERGTGGATTNHAAHGYSSPHAQNVQPSGQTSMVFTAEEWDSIEQSLTREIVRQDQQREAADIKARIDQRKRDQAAAKAAALAKQQAAHDALVAKQKAAHDIWVAKQQTEQARKYLLTHPQQPIYYPPQGVLVNDCNADQPSNPEACGITAPSSSDRIAR